jgi:hypothetical protein
VGEQERNDIQAVEQVFPEASPLHLPAQLFVAAARMRTSTDRVLLATHPFEFPGLQHPQKLDLRGQGNFPHFIQEDGAAVGLLKAADFLAQGPGEGPFLMAEEFAFQQGGRVGGTVDDHKGSLLAVAQAVNGPGHQLLAGAAFSLDEHGGVGWGHILMSLHNLHLGVLPTISPKP